MGKCLAVIGPSPRMLAPAYVLDVRPGMSRHLDVPVYDDELLFGGLKPERELPRRDTGRYANSFFHVNLPVVDEIEDDDEYLSF